LALFDDLAKGATTPAGIAVGIGAALLAPVLVPAVSQFLRPAAKAAMRTGITLYRSTVEPLSAAVGGLVAEAQLELATASAGSAAAAPEPATPEAPRPTHKRRAAHH
jgi:hypothetical protein